MNLRTTVLSLFLIISLAAHAQEKTETTTVPSVPKTDAPAPKPAEEKKWYEKINFRGYMQVRQNNLFNSNENLGCEQCDRTWGGNGGVSIKRARTVFYGQVYKNVYFKLEADFATAVSPTPTNQNFVQVRDAYFDIAFDDNNEFWVRLGQSKVPYGFEILQSSQNRITLDRSDAINSAFLTERDLGAIFYWAPKEIRKMYGEFTSQNYKGSGDYGVIGVGIVNGQGANRAEMNKKQHVIVRASYPIKIGSQIIEPGLQGYTGKYVMFDSQLSAGVTNTSADKNYTDRRAAASFILYPRPFGIQAEYNIGEGPEFDKASQSIKVKNLQGGYATLSYRAQYKNMFFFPFARYQYYTGGKKFELDARSYTVHQVDFGVEWQMNKNFEFTAEYVFANRRYEDYTLQTNHQTGNGLRVQAQVNF
jgi:hypothetical protein